MSIDRSYILAIGMAFLPAVVFAQLRELQSVDVIADAIRLPEVGQSIHVFDSLQIQHQSFFSADKVLQQNPAYFGRSYGPGMATTPTYRGFNASQFNQYWNGVLLNSPALGLFDMSSWTLADGDEFQIENGAGAIQYGSGYLGGGMHLNRDWSDSITKVELETKIGSFGFQGFRVNAEYHYENWSFRTLVDHVQADNDFSYSSYNGEELIRLGANFNQASLQQYGRYTWSKTQKTEFGYWGQSIDRHIPNSITGPYRIGALQNDDYHRFYLKHEWASGAHTFAVSESFSSESMRYLDESILVNDTNLAQNFNTDFHWKYKISGNVLISSGLHHVFQSVGGSTKQEANRNQWGVYSHLTWNTSWGVGRIGVRGERSSQVSAPLIPSVEWRLPLGKWLDLKAFYTSHYRFPTLNDLYYRPGGYPNLLPENGYMVGGSVLFKQESIGHVSVEAFSGVTSNYIQWIQVGNFWSPRNIKDVGQSGVETSIQLHTQILKFILNTRLGYAFTNAKVLTSTQTNDPSIGKPLIYVPKNRLTAGTNISFERWIFTWNMQFTGPVYTSPDQWPSTKIPAYFLHDFYLGYRYHWKWYNFSLTTGMNNAFNIEYQTQKNYPMPGRSYFISLKIGFKQ